MCFWGLQVPRGLLSDEGETECGAQCAGGLERTSWLGVPALRMTKTYCPLSLHLPSLASHGDNDNRNNGDSGHV